MKGLKSAPIEPPNPSTVRSTCTAGINASASIHTNPNIIDTPITTVTQSHPPIQPRPQPHPQRNVETVRQWGGRQLQQPPQHVPSENHLTLQHASGIVRASTTQSHPQPPHSAAQAELPTPQSMPAGVREGRMIRCSVLPPLMRPSECSSACSSSFRSPCVRNPSALSPLF